MMHTNNRLLRIVYLCAALLPISANAQVEDVIAAFDAHHIAAYLVAAFLISAWVMLFFNRVTYFRERQVNMEAEKVNEQLATILELNKTQAWTFDIHKQIFTIFTKQGHEETVYHPFDFSQFYDVDDFAELRKMILKVSKWESRFDTLIVKGAPDKANNSKQRIYEVTVSILRYDLRNKPIILLGTQQDITEKQEKMEQSRNLMLQYHTVFNSSLVDMTYFDADGYLIDMNDKACESLNIPDRQALIDSKMNIHDMPALSDIDLEKVDKSYFSTILPLQNIHTPMGTLDGLTPSSVLYYEQDLNVTRDHSGKIQSYILAGRNISDMVESQHQEEEAQRQLEQTTNDIHAYISNINYSLKVSNVRLINYSPDLHVMEVSSDINQTQYRLTQVRALSLLTPSMRRMARGFFTRMDRRKEGMISTTLETILHDEQGRNIYMHFSMMPITDKSGNVTHYFGMCRNETEMTYAEMKLQEETEKAQEAEKLKNTFLLNMSHELRTPLNAVIGFASLFKDEHSEEDEPVFAEEIKKNTNTLLQLINDILFLSRLDARMIEHNYEVSDFALLFEGWCYMGWSNLSPETKVAVENPYSQLLVNIDQQNLAMVIGKVCYMSAMHTPTGSIRAKYEYRQGELMITIEDNGRGLSPKALSKLFDRFVHDEDIDLEGTGLDMPIVQELLEQMGGTIEVQSEEGKGASVFINVPCEMTSLEKKAEITI